MPPAARALRMFFRFITTLLRAWLQHSGLRPLFVITAGGFYTIHRKCRERLRQNNEALSRLSEEFFAVFLEFDLGPSDPADGVAVHDISDAVNLL